MNPQDKQHLTRDVQRVAHNNTKIQELKWEIKEIADAAWNKYGIKGKVVKQLAKESAWDGVQREERRQFEESLDECRAALGMLADLPLGQAAQEARAPARVRANGQANGHAETKRGPGRPRGARNKTKPAADDWSRPPRSAPPDFPDAG